jgi:lipopolysaccharide export system ATP-binding protein
MLKLAANHITKKYGKRKVVDDVSIEVSQGEIVGLLGPNGAGKTTSFYTIVGLIKPNSGSIRIEMIAISPLIQCINARKTALAIWHKRHPFFEN